MPQIRELLTASVTAIIRYHETKIATHPSTESLTVQQLLAATYPEMMERLSTLISESITAAKDETRRPLLNYLLYITGVLRSFVDQHKPSDDAALINIKLQLLQFFIDIGTLLKTSQSIQLPVHYDEKTVPLFGLVRGILAGYALSDSGTILKNTLFSTLQLAADAQQGVVKIVLNDVIDAHQRMLQVEAREAAVHARELQLQARELEMKARETAKSTAQPNLTPSIHPSPGFLGIRAMPPLLLSRPSDRGFISSIPLGLHTNGLWGLVARQASLSSRREPNPSALPDEIDEFNIRQ